MKRFFLAASIASVVFASCGSESTTTDSTETNTITDSTLITPAPDTTNNSLPPVVQDTAKTSSTITMPPVSLPVANPQPTVNVQSSNVQPSSTQPATTQPATSTAGLNPEHGKPGHRCDIAVGAPLNSQPAATTAAAPPKVQATQVATPATTPAPTGPKPKLNPAHGQPYHDCAIKVGDPLKS